MLMMVVSAIVNSKTLILILRCCKECKTKLDYCNLGRYTFGDLGYFVVITFYFLMGYFQMVSFLVACSEALGKILEFEWSQTEWKLLAFLFCLPTTFMRSLKQAAVLSLIANIATLLMLVCIIILSIHHMWVDGVKFEQLKWVPNSFADFSSSLPIILISFSIQVGGVVILNTLQDPSYNNMKKITNDGYI